MPSAPYHNVLLYLVHTTPPHPFPTPRSSSLTNTGDAPLTLTNIPSVPTGFTLVSNFGSTTLAPAAFTTFVIRLDANVPGAKSGSISFGNNDRSEERRVGKETESGSDPEITNTAGRSLTE